METQHISEMLWFACRKLRQWMSKITTLNIIKVIYEAALNMLISSKGIAPWNKLLSAHKCLKTVTINIQSNPKSKIVACSEVKVVALFQTVVC
jgi:hypothetical protein